VEPARDGLRQLRAAEPPPTAIVCGQRRPDVRRAARSAAARHCRAAAAVHLAAHLRPAL